MLKKRRFLINAAGILALSSFVFFGACTDKKTGSPAEPPPAAEEIPPDFPPEPGLPEAQALILRLEPYREQAALIAAAMDDRQLAAQSLLTGLESSNFLGSAMRYMLSEIPAGGIMLYRANLAAGKDEIHSFLSECAAVVAENTGAAPFIAVDHEGGLVHRFGAGVMRLPSAYHFWETAEAVGMEASLARLEELVTQSAKEIRELGITMNLAPVAEILSAENKAFLETRSYGPDAAFVEMAASAFIRAMDSQGIACVLKHFPGNSADDPHYRESIISADYDKLLSMTEPFRGILSNYNPSAVMISHSITEAVDSGRNSSLSPLVINWLREDFGFNGIVIADDFGMRAVTSRGISSEEAAVLALNAGVDMIMCWPHNIVSVHAAVLEALNDGRLPRERLLDAATRILMEKIRYGLIP